MKKNTLDSSATKELYRKYLKGNRSALVKTVLATALLATPIVQILPPTVAQAHQQVDTSLSVVINGERQQFSSPPFVRQGITYIPIRNVTERLGGKVSWDHNSKTVVIHKNGYEISFVVGANHGKVNERTVQMQPSIVVNDRVMVPLRFISESLGMNVHWEGKMRTVFIDDQAAVEVLDWSNANIAFPIGQVARVIDVETGKSFYIKRTFGANHADSEPLTAKDAEIMREVWGGNFSWTPRAIVLEFDNRRLAAAMHSFPHDIQEITNNNYNGHFCIHFVNSTRHKDGQVQTSMQQQIWKAAQYK